LRLFRMRVLPRRLIFPSIKKGGGSTRSKFVQTVRLFSQLRFKAHDIGGLGHDHQSGILWPAYPILLCALGPRSASSSDAEKARRTRPQEARHHPERLIRSTRSEGLFRFIVEIAI